MLIKFLKRDMKFGTEKSIKYLIIIMIFIIMPLVSYIKFTENFNEVIYNLLILKFENSENIFKNNIFVITIQVFVLLSYCKYIYDDLFTYNKLILSRYKSRKKFCITKIFFIFIYNIMIIFTIVMISYICFLMFKVNIENINILLKMLLCYSLGSISLSLINLLISMKFKESIAFFISVIFISLNLIFKTFIFPGGGYISMLFDGNRYIYSLIYNIFLIAIISLSIIIFYKKIDLN